MNSKPKPTRSRIIDLRTPSAQHEPQASPVSVSKSNEKVTPPQPEPPKPQKSKKNIKRILLFLVAISLLALAIYIALLLFWPKAHKPKTTEETQQTITQAQEEGKNILIIPAIGVNTQVLEGGEEQLDHGVLHWLPKNGNPESGGNTILTGHSFVWGYIPQQIKEKSIFYNLHEVKVGDPIEVVWNKKHYSYKVTEVKSVKPNQTEIQDKTADPQLTVYTCTIGGSADGRVVVIAKPST